MASWPIWPVSMLKSLQIKYICWVLPFRDYIPNFNQIGRKMPKLCTFFTIRLVGWWGARPVWPVSMLKSLQIKYICWVLPFRDSIPNFSQIGWKMPKLCTFLVADTQLYKRLCPSVRWSVHLGSSSWKVGKRAFKIRFGDGMGCVCPCPPVRNDIVTSRHLLSLIIRERWIIRKLYINERRRSHTPNNSIFHQRWYVYHLFTLYIAHLRVQYLSIS